MLCLDALASLACFTSHAGFAGDFSITQGAGFAGDFGVTRGDGFAGDFGVTRGAGSVVPFTGGTSFWCFSQTTPREKRLLGSSGGVMSLSSEKYLSNRVCFLLS